MRGFIVLAMFAVALVQADSSGSNETRELTRDAGAGSSTVTGTDGGTPIAVKAAISVDVDGGSVKLSYDDTHGSAESDT